MTYRTYQEKQWNGNLGKKYTERNILTPHELDKLTRKDYGITMTELNNLFIGKFKRNIRILEVGSNNGNQLLLLKKMGFKNIYGIDVNDYAIECAKKRCKKINVIKGSALDIPFKSNYFDIVFTAGVLIHIHPQNIEKALTEIYRCSSGYILGLEYYSNNYVEAMYRKKNNLLWKADFKNIYLKLFGDLKLVKKKKLNYLYDDNADMLFLLKKTKC